MLQQKFTYSILSLCITIVCTEETMLEKSIFILNLRNKKVQQSLILFILFVFSCLYICLSYSSYKNSRFLNDRNYLNRNLLVFDDFYVHRRILEVLHLFSSLDIHPICCRFHIGLLDNS